MNSEVTVKQLATTVGIPVERLLAQLNDAGIPAADADATITEQEKVQLLTHLRRSHGKQEPDNSSSPDRVTLKRKSVSELRQTASGARPTAPSRPTPAQRANKTVSVEVRRKRTYVRRDEAAGGTAPALATPAAPQTPPTARAAATVAVQQRPPRRNEATAVARPPLEKRRAPGDEQRRRAELEARRAEEEARRLAEREDLDRQQKKEEARRRAEEEERRREQEEARRLAAEEAELARLAAEQRGTKIVEPEPVIDDDYDADADAEERPLKGGKKIPERVVDKDKAVKDKAVKKTVRKEPGRAKKIETAAEYEEEETTDTAILSRPAVRRRKKPAKPQLQDMHGFQRPTAPVVREVAIPESISVAELASRMSVKAAEVVKELFKQGMMVTINQVLDRDTATILVEEMGHKPVAANDQDAEDSLLAFLEAENEQIERLPRPPVVTIMGHVDHGKTSLLDFIRRTRVADGEAGGITQHIGAYHVETTRGTICFLDTPGHAAFSAMRARGAEVTDIVILVVAADDGVMPQTAEAIQHARASKVPLIVAMNKMDKPDANPDRVMQDLTQHEIVAEEWGGETMMVKVSAKTGAGIEELLDAILLQAEVLELKAPVTGSAHGTIIESSLEKGRGPVATVLVQSGTLRAGDTIVSGGEYGRVRAMFDEAGRPVQSAGPSIPVQVLGLSGAPNAGDDVIAVADEKRAREVAELRQQRGRQSKIDEQRVASLDQIFSQFKDGEIKNINLILKADVQGSVEAIKDSLLKLSTDEVKVSIVASGVGGITESDANLAVTSRAILIGFNVRADPAARRIIEEKGLDLRYFSIIYELIDAVRKAMSGLLSPIVSEEIIGLAQVRDVFRSSKFGAIAGTMVTEGMIRRNHPIRVLRDNVVVFEGALESLRRFKDDVSEVKAGMECGIGVKNYNDVRVGDQIEVFERTVRAREL